MEQVKKYGGYIVGLFLVLLFAIYALPYLLKMLFASISGGLGGGDAVTKTNLDDYNLQIKTIEAVKVGTNLTHDETEYHSVSDAIYSRLSGETVTSEDYQYVTNIIFEWCKTEDDIRKLYKTFSLRSYTRRGWFYNDYVAYTLPKYISVVYGLNSYYRDDIANFTTRFAWAGVY